MEEIQIYARVTITILGLAYPILLQVIARLDEKYSSNYIVELFDKEKVKKVFTFFLILSLISIFIWTFKFPPLIQIEELNWIINNSANLLVIGAVTTLVTSFFFFVNKILIYYTPAKFINYLIKNYKDDPSNFSYFEALTDVFLLSIRKNNYVISETISRFYYDIFKYERQKFKEKPVQYPYAYYSLIYKSIEELAIQKKKRNSSLINKTSGGLWLLGESETCEISETTYSWLWHNILLAIEYEQDDLILCHWEKANQYFIYDLAYIENEYKDLTDEILNEDAVKKRELEREKFLEFHYALGGLLMYKQRYNCLKRVFNYTVSHPPKYELLPDKMDEIFKKYLEFGDPHSRKLFWISSKYPFPEQSGINSNDIIRKWISTYLAVLFLRQYTIVKYMIYMKPLEFPQIPALQREKRKWIESLDFFNKLVENNIENRELINSLNYNFLTPEWCEVHNKKYPIDFIIELKEILETKYEEDAINMNVSEVRKNEFLIASGKILQEVFIEYNKINNPSKIEKNYSKRFINGALSLENKDAFSENPEVHYINSDTYLAHGVAKKIKEEISLSFWLNKSKVYLFEIDDIFKAIDRLKIDETYIIISFNVNLKYYSSHLAIDGLSADYYKGVKILSFSGSRHVNQSLFIVKRENLPKFLYKELSEEEIEKFSLEKRNVPFNIYMSLLDLNQIHNLDELKNGYLQGHSDIEIRKSLLLSLALLTEIRWKKDIDLIQLMQYSKYFQKGLPDKLDDIVPIKKD